MTESTERLSSALADRYQILSRLGEGGMATVYLAEDLKHKRQVAVKVLKPELAAVLGAERFVQEITTTANLQHPHILPLFDSGEADGFLYYVMPYVKGESLRALLDRKKQLPIDQALEITKVVASALGHAHRQGVIHRDIKPENILLADDGQPLVADFGIALAVNEAGGTRLTETGMSLGTPEYMSPEQATGDRLLEPASDIYSLGAVLYEMLVGDPPHMGNTAQAIIARIITEKPAGIRTVRDTVPQHVEAAIMKALAKVPADRYGTAERFAVSLTTTDSAVRKTVAGAEPGARKKTARLASAAFVIAVAAGGLGLWLIPSGGPGAITEAPWLAVLPFDNLGSPEDEYFAAGMTDEITSRLAEISGLRVISRQSTIQYQGSTKTLREIGEELGVEYILEGTIRTDRMPDGGGKMRVTPRLIKVAADAYLWTDRYTVTLVPGDIFRVQEQLAEEVARALDVTLLEPERRRLAATPTDNLEAYQYFLQGNDYSSRGFEGKDSRIAVEMYQKAVDLDPDFAVAYARLSIVHSRMWFLFFDRTDARLAKAKDAVDRALALAPDLADAHAALGYYYYWGFLDYQRALDAFTVAREGQPNKSDIFSGIAFVRRRQGNMEDALANLLRAAELEPRSAVLLVHIAETYALTRKTAQAEHYYDRAISLRPDWGVPYYSQAWMGHLRNHGSTERARATLELAADAGVIEHRIDHLWVLLFMLERDYQAALAQMARLPPRPPEQFRYIPKAQLYADIHGLLGNQELSRTYYDSARTVVEALIRDVPYDGRYHSALGIAYAGLGRAEDAVREGELAVQMLPVSKEAWRGAYRVEDLARIYTMVGRYDQAIDRLEYMLSIPSDLSAPMLAIDPTWDPLREHPRFQELLGEAGRK